jgi:hypothetical protein
MPLVRRVLAVTFDLGQGSFGESGANRVKIGGIPPTNQPGLRASANIVEAGGPSMGSLDLTVWGLNLSTMNQLNTLGLRAQMIRRNTVTLEAGDTERGLTAVYQGTIRDAWIDFDSMPSVAFRVMCFAALYEAVKPIPPTTINGVADVASILSGLAAQAGVGFQNNGVTGSLYNPYFPGTIREQIARCAEHAHINWDLSNGYLTIWPKNGQRSQFVPLVRPDTGMVGYPGFQPMGVRATILFDPSIRYGQKIRMESDLKGANGEWIISKMAHSLDSEIPNGQWFTRFEANEPGFAGVSNLPGARPNG